MAGSLILDLRRAVIIRLAADPGVTALVPADQLYPSTTPADTPWPFGRFDGAQSVPLDGNCFEGATVTFLYHAFAKPRYDGDGPMVETAEDHAGRIADAMKLALHRRRLPIGDTSALIRVRSVRLMPDGAEQDAYHAILSCEARIIA